MSLLGIFISLFLLHPDFHCYRSILPASFSLWIARRLLVFYSAQVNKGSLLSRSGAAYRTLFGNQSSPLLAFSFSFLPLSVSSCLCIFDLLFFCFSFCILFVLLGEMGCFPKRRRSHLLVTLSIFSNIMVGM